MVDFKSIEELNENLGREFYIPRATHGVKGYSTKKAVLKKIPLLKLYSLLYEDGLVTNDIDHSWLLNSNIIMFENFEDCEQFILDDKAA